MLIGMRKVYISADLRPHTFNNEATADQKADEPGTKTLRLDNISYIGFFVDVRKMLQKFVKEKG